MELEDKLMNLEEAQRRILAPDEMAKKQCEQRWDSIAHPLHSLGKLEDGLAKLASIQRTHEVKLSKKGIIIMCADNGVVEEGVTQTGSEITALVTNNFISGDTSVAIMCKQLGVDMYPIDIGVQTDTKARNKKIARGTKNMTKEPAMSRDEAVKAIEVGIDAVFELKEEGYHIIATGEMGIGNTTTSSAVATVLLNEQIERMTGKGAGLSDAGLLRKKDAIRKAIALNHPNAKDPIDVMAKVGGLDIAGLTGVFLGGAAAGIPIVIDGFISSVAALAAIRIEPKVQPYLIPSHVSKEPAGQLLLDTLGLSAYLTCDMCLGEGTGAVAVFPLFDLALSVYNSMSTFQQIDMDAYEHLS